MGRERIELSLLVLQTSALTNLATAPIYCCPDRNRTCDIHIQSVVALPTSPTGQCDYLRNLFKMFFTTLNLILIDLGSCLKVILLDSNVPDNTSFLFIYYFYFLRRVWDSNPQDPLHVLLLFKSSSSSCQILSLFIFTNMSKNFSLDKVTIFNL